MFAIVETEVDDVYYKGYYDAWIYYK